MQPKESPQIPLMDADKNKQPRINAKYANHLWFLIRIESRNSRLA